MKMMKMTIKKLATKYIKEAKDVDVAYLAYSGLIVIRDSAVLTIAIIEKMDNGTWKLVLKNPYVNGFLLLLKIKGKPLKLKQVIELIRNNFDDN